MNHTGRQTRISEVAERLLAGLCADAEMNNSREIVTFAFDIAEEFVGLVEQRLKEARKADEAASQ